MTISASRPIERIRRGQIIRAAYLDTMAQAINDLNGTISPPAQIGAPAEPEQINSATGEVWREITRSTDTVRIENPDDPEQYVDVERVMTVTMSRPDGSSVLMIFTQ